MAEREPTEQNHQLKEDLHQRLDSLPIKDLLEQVQQQWQIGEVKYLQSTTDFVEKPEHVWVAYMLTESHPDVIAWRSVSSLNLDTYSETVKLEKGYRTNAIVVGLVNESKKNGPRLFVTPVYDDWQPWKVVYGHDIYLADPFDGTGNFEPYEFTSADQSQEALTAWVQDTIKRDGMRRSHEEPLTQKAEKGQRLHDAVQLPIWDNLVGRDGPLRRWKLIEEEYDEK